MIRTKSIIAILLLASLLVASGCLQTEKTDIQTKKLKVVTTVAPITNIVKNIGGDKIELYGIIPEGVDSHTFEPIPSDIKFLSDADLIIVNGLNLELPTVRLAEANKKPSLSLGDNTITRREWAFDRSFPEEEGDPNPHLWLNVKYAMRYAELVRDELIKFDPANKEYYEENANRYLTLLDKLDKAVMATVQTIPPRNRKLLTYHDSWPYFARKYGMTVIGAIQPSDFSEPSSKELAGIIYQIKKEGVPAVFGSDVYPSEVMDQIARETKIQFVTTLRDDSLPGQSDAPEHTYAGLMLKNLEAMATSLGGNTDALKDIDPKNTFK